MTQRKLFCREMKRAVINKGMVIAIFMGTVINILHIVNYMNFSILELFASSDNTYKPYYVQTTVNFWMNNSISPYLYYLYYLMPFLAVLPYGMELYRERKTGFVKNVLIREDRKSYAIRRCMATFIAGGISAAYPIVLSYAFVTAFIPTSKTLPFYTVPIPYDWLSELFFDNIFLYVFIYCFMYFMVGGILAVMALLVSSYIDNLLTVFLAPFLFMIVLLFIQERITIIDSNIPLLKYFPFNFLICIRSMGGTTEILIGLVMITLILGYLFYCRIKKVEIY